MASIPNTLYPTLPNANHGSPGMMYVFDNTTIISGGGQPVTGAWRPVSPGDLSANISLTGGVFNAAVDDVAVTGGFIAISNTPGVIVQNGILPISGNVNSTITNSILPVSGISTVVGGVYTPSFSIVTGSQVIIPVGVRSASVSIVSGTAYVNGTGPVVAGVTLKFGGYDGRYLSSAGVVVGATGSALFPCQVLILWET